MYGAHAKGWGSLPVEARLGKTMWHTSIFPDAQSGTYLLPLKAKVRSAEGVFEGDVIVCALEILSEITKV